MKSALVVHKPPAFPPPSEVIHGGGIWASNPCGRIGVNVRLTPSGALRFFSARRTVLHMTKDRPTCSEKVCCIYRPRCATLLNGRRWTRTAAFRQRPGAPRGAIPVLPVGGFEGLPGQRHARARVKARQQHGKNAGQEYAVKSPGAADRSDGRAGPRTLSRLVRSAPISVPRLPAI
jgi:hypothetical protein